MSTTYKSRQKEIDKLDSRIDNITIDTEKLEDDSELLQFDINSVIKSLELVTDINAERSIDISNDSSSSSNGTEVKVISQIDYYFMEEHDPDVLYFIYDESNVKEIDEILEI